MKRHGSLIPLTHDHHHTLGQARRLRFAAEAGAGELGVEARRFIKFFEEDALPHFNEEEWQIFPLVVDIDDGRDLVSRLLEEHKTIRLLVDVLRVQVRSGQMDADTSRLLARVIEAHIRLEERKLFPLVEEHVSSAELAAISLRPRIRELSA